MLMSYKSSKQNRNIHIGDVYLIHFEGTGNEQRGLRPGLVFQNNLGNAYSPNIIALPLTSAIKKTAQPTHVFIPCDGTGLSRDSLVLCENPERISKDRLGAYITTISDEYMSKIAIASLLATSAISFISPDAVMAVWQRAVSLNSAV